MNFEGVLSKKPTLKKKKSLWCSNDPKFGNRWFLNMNDFKKNDEELIMLNENSKKYIKSGDVKLSQYGSFYWKDGFL